MMKIGNVRDLGSLGVHIINSTHAVDVTDNSTFGPNLDGDPVSGMLRIGNMYDDAPEDIVEDKDPDDLEIDKGTIPGVDWSEYLGYRDPEYGRDGFVSMPLAMLGQRPRYGSNVMLRRMRGDPGVFISSPAGGGSVGAMDDEDLDFVDTDGFTVRYRRP